MKSTENKILGTDDTTAFLDMIATALVKTNKFNVVDDRIDAILSEQSGIARGSSQPNFNFQGADFVDYLGEEVTDPDTGEVIGRDEQHVGSIKVTEANNRFSVDFGKTRMRICDIQILGEQQWKKQ